MSTLTAPPRTSQEVSNLTDRESLVRLREMRRACPPRAARRRAPPSPTFALCARSRSQRALRASFAQTLMKNLLRVCVSTICFQRALFPPDCFRQKKLSGIAVQHLQCKTKDKLTNKVIVHNEEGALLTSWLEEGVFDALQKRYLKTLQFAVTNGDDTGDNVLESYHFEFKYPSSETFTVNGDAVDAGRLKAQAQKLMRNLTELSHTLDDLPDARAITMALRYYDDVTPPDYEPAFFVGAEADALRRFAAPDGRKTLKVKIGQVTSQHHALKMLLETASYDWSGGTESTADGTRAKDAASAAPPHAADERVEDISESEDRAPPAAAAAAPRARRASATPRPCAAGSSRRCGRWRS